MTELGKQVWEKMEEMGWENAPEGFYLQFYENIIECTKQVLNIPLVVGESEQYFCSKQQIGQRCSRQCLGCFQFENKD